MKNRGEKKEKNEKIEGKEWCAARTGRGGEKKGVRGKNKFSVGIDGNASV